MSIERFKEVGAELRNWGRWGPADRIGTLNLITAERRLAATRLVRDGRCIDLGLPIGPGGVPQRSGSPRFDPVHLMLRTPDETWPGGMVGADDMVALPLQAGTQWDGLGHIGYDGQMYNGVAATSVSSSGSNELSVHQLAQAGVIGRGVLLDIPALLDVEILEAGFPITAEHLSAAASLQRVEVAAGDIILLRTGWMRHWTANRDAVTFWSGQPGLELTSACWLRERDVAALLADNSGVEAMPTNPAFGTAWPVHCVLIRDVGMTLGEMAVLEELAQHCRHADRWDFLFMAAPLKVEGAVGAPITPIAVV